MILIDPQHEYLFKLHKWYKHSEGYLINASSHYFHRLIMKATNKEYVDHINGNRLDNRVKNLRLTNKQQNAWNRAKTIKPTSSIYKGVTYRVKNQKWEAMIWFNNIGIYLGRFKTQEEAALAYNEKAAELFGQYARLNVILK